MFSGILKRKINAALQKMPGYQGQVQNVQFHVWKGLISVQNLHLQNEHHQMVVDISDLSVHFSWKQALKGVLVADVALASPRLWIQAPESRPSLVPSSLPQLQDQALSSDTVPQNVAHILRQMIPFEIQTIVLRDGSIGIHPGQSLDGSEGNVLVSALQFDIHHFTNAKGPVAQDNPTAQGDITAMLAESGTFHMAFHVNPLMRPPVFQFDAEAMHVNLAALRPVIAWQTGMDIKQGSLDVFMEAHSSDGGFEGYVKPFVTDLKLLDYAQDKRKGFWTLVKEALGQFLSSLLQNKQTHAVASRIPFYGQFESPQIGVWEAMSTALRNGFVKALNPGLDG